MRELQRTITICGLLLVAVLATEAAHAQAITTYVVGYNDGDETTLGLVEAQVAPARLGWRPVASIEAVLIGYGEGAEDRGTLWSVSPGAGIQYAGAISGLTARGSYQVVTEEEFGTRFYSGGKSGFAATVQGQYWGAIPAVEALVRHNFASNFLWTQLQAYRPVIGAPPGSIDLGAEYVFQGDLDEDDTRAQMVGPLIRWATGTGVFAMLSGGLKHNLGPADSTWYGKAGLVFAP